MKKDIASLFMKILLIVTLIFFPSCIHKKQVDKQKLLIDTKKTVNRAASNATTPPPVTIWVHGTLILRKPSYHLVFEDKTSLVPILSLEENHHFRQLATTITQQGSEHFPLEEFYIFSWSGKLQEEERKIAAHRLYEEIASLQQSYHLKYNQEPIIRIIAHSHGGNVTLNMAKIRNITHCFTIESLILLACPVQERTKHLICTPMFKRVYSLYSSLDIIQILAPQFKLACSTDPETIGNKKRYCIPPFSSRLFPTYSHLTQAKIKINDFPISHTRFSTKEFASILPMILEKLNSWHIESLALNTISKHKLLCIHTPKKNC